MEGIKKDRNKDYLNPKEGTYYDKKPNASGPKPVGNATLG